jgi:hypothetical protein
MKHAGDAGEPVVMRPARVAADVMPQPALNGSDHHAPVEGLKIDRAQG